MSKKEEEIREDAHDVSKLYDPEAEAPPFCDGCGADHFGACTPEVEECGHCGGEIDDQGECFCNDEPDDEPGDGLTDVEADSMTLASAGWGTDMEAADALTTWAHANRPPVVDERTQD